MPNFFVTICLSIDFAKIIFYLKNIFLSKKQELNIEQHFKAQKSACVKCLSKKKKKNDESHSSTSGKNFGGIEFFPNFIHNCPNHDSVAFHGDEKCYTFSCKKTNED